MKKKIILSSVLTIVLCLSLIAGSTFALFTSEDKVNVAVNSGTVKVLATASEPQYGTTLANKLPQSSATLNGNTVTLDRMVPGDYVTFDITVSNLSDVSVLYRTLITKENDNGLWDALTVEIDGETFDGTAVKKSDWASLTPNSDDKVISVKISLPETAGNAVQGKSCSFTYVVKAVQANADLPSEWRGETDVDSEGLNANTDNEAKTVKIETAAQLAAFAASVDGDNDNHGNFYTGYTVTLEKDIDLDGQIWPGIGSLGTGSYPSVFFNGTFDGQGHTISNMTTSNLTGNPSTTGFFNGIGRNATIKNLNFDNANVTGNHYAGVVVGYLNAAAGNGVVATPYALIENCHVTNSSVNSVPHNQGGDYEDGDKAGGIIGAMLTESQFTVKNCSVKNTTITGVRDLGGIVGIYDGQISGCSVENVTILRDSSKIDRNENIGSIGGRKNSNDAQIIDCTGEATVGTKIAEGVSTNAAGEYLISNPQGLVCNELQQSRYYHQQGL